LTTLYSFCAQQNCADGRIPSGFLVRDAAGNYYGTTDLGGTHGDYGTIFELKATKQGYSFVQLYSFCALANCADGIEAGSLILDVNGALYGTAPGGGVHSGGTIFRLVPDARHTKWKLETLYDFCSQANCVDGEGPTGITYSGAQNGKLYDGTSPIFGATAGGGVNNLPQGDGTAFKLVFVAGKTRRKEKVIYDFCSQLDCLDGRFPSGGLVMDKNGNLYGLTDNGGGALDGIAYELSPSNPTYTERTLYSFCQMQQCADGKIPVGTVVMDSQGNLYGATLEGGEWLQGTVFEIVPPDINDPERILHSFCPSNPCSDGATPETGLALDGKGNIYGTTFAGGPAKDGVVYTLTTGGTGEYGIYSFCALQNCADGSEPSGVTVDPSGNLFGATTTGGANGSGGTLFELTP